MVHIYNIIKKIGFLFMVFTAFIWLGCTKTSSGTGGPGGGGGPAAPTINSVVPDTAAFNTKVVINGTNFGTSQTVTFNGVIATVSSATATQLTVLVPKGAGTGNVNVKVGTQTAGGPEFYYLYTYTVSTLAGGTQGDLDGTGSAAEFNNPFGIAVDTSGNVIVADDFNDKIRKVTPNGVVTTVAGTGMSGYMNGAAATALFLDPPSVAVDAMNNILVGDAFNYKIRQISTAGIVSTIAGTTVGETDGVIATAQFDSPSELADEASGKIYVCDAHYIRVISGGSVTTLYDGHNYSSQLVDFTSIAIGQNNNLILLDDFGANVFNLTTAGVFTVLAGNGIPEYLDGPAASAGFSSATSVAVDAKGNILVADEANQRIRMISPAGIVSTIAGTGVAGEQDGPASSAQLYNPHGVAVDNKSGNIYVVEPNSNRIRKITAE